MGSKKFSSVGIPALEREWTEDEMRAVASIPIERGSGNVFLDLGYVNAVEHQLKAQIVEVISRLMREKNLTQAELAQMIGLDQPKVSKLLRGQTRDFSMERLLGIVNRLGRDVKVYIDSEERPATEAHTLLIVA